MASQPTTISSTSNHLIKTIRKLSSSSSFRKQQRRFVCEHVSGIKDCLTHRPDLIELICIRKSSLETIPTDFLRAGPYIIIDDSIFKSLSSIKQSAGVLAVCIRPEYEDTELSDLFKSFKRIIICDQLNNPSNLGAVIRNAIAFNIDAIAITPNSVDPYHPDSIRAMAGNFFQRPILECDETIFNTHIVDAYSLYSLSIHATSTISSIKQDSKLGLLVGSEAHGIRSTFIHEKQDQIQAVKIPMSSAIDSLNVAVSAGIVFYELNRNVLY